MWIGIALGGALGALTRWIFAAFCPWPTFVVNVIGCGFMGFALALSVHHAWSEQLRLPLTVGFLGALTTYSTYTLEIVHLLQKSQLKEALAYIFLTHVISLTVFAVFYLGGMKWLSAS